MNDVYPYWMRFCCGKQYKKKCCNCNCHCNCLGILLRHAHLAGVMDHRPVRQRVSTDTHMENQELLLCDNLNRVVPLVSTTTTYQNDTPGAVPRQPWQLVLSANHWLVKSDVFLMAFTAAVWGNACYSLNTYRCIYSQHASSFFTWGHATRGMAVFYTL